MHLQCDTSVPQLKRSASGESRGSDTSSASSNRTLLFGEIPSPTSPLSSSSDVRSRADSLLNASKCNLIMCGSIAFQRFWTNDKARDNFMRHVPDEDLCSMRLVCHDFRSRAAPYLFEEVNVNFNSRSFTKPARIKALDKIGHHVKTFTFNMPHTSQSNLPPLINQETGIEMPFHYEPQIHYDPKVPRYGTWDMTNLMVQQYPPLFHAATNVPSFVRALAAMPNITHVKISCPGQAPFHRYRRSIVDYALISLRIAIERNSLDELNTLSLFPMHTGGLLYLQPGLGFGATPEGAARWNQIRKLNIQMDNVSRDKSTQTSHLRILHSYLRFFSHALTHLHFLWLSHRGPSPFSLHLEPTVSTPTPHHRIAPSPPALKPLKFPRLQHMELENALMDSSQISAFIHTHRRRLTEFNFEDVHLRSGTWDEALAPLTRIAGNENWKARQEEIMEVPICFAPSFVGPGGGAEQMRVEGMLMGQEVVSGREREKEVRERKPTLSRWLGGSRQKRVGCEAGEGMRRFLKGSLFPWR